MKTLAASIEIMRDETLRANDGFSSFINEHHKRRNRYHKIYFLHEKLIKYANNISDNNQTNRFYFDSIQMVYDSMTLYDKDFSKRTENVDKAIYKPVNDSLEFLILKSRVYNMTMKIQDVMAGSFYTHKARHYYYQFIPGNSGIIDSGKFKIAVVHAQYTYISDSTYCKLIQNNSVVATKTITEDDYYFTYKDLPKGKYTLECESYLDEPELFDPTARDSYYFEIK